MGGRPLAIIPSLSHKRLFFKQPGPGIVSVGLHVVVKALTYVAPSSFHIFVICQQMPLPFAIDTIHLVFKRS
jgi:hypothetical protein